MNVELVKTFRIEAAHHSRMGRDSDHLHGHSYEIGVVVQGVCDEKLGWLIDYAYISKHVEPLLRHLDHFNLNEVLESEEVYEADVAEWLSQRLAPNLPGLKLVSVGVVGPCLFSTEQQEADPKLDLPPRVRFGFEAAHALPNLPPDHKCRRMHGHSFVVEAAAGDLDALTPHLQPVYDRLAHRCLNRIEGLDNPTSENVARWIWNELSRDVEELSSVVVAETCSARCIYRGE